MHFRVVAVDGSYPSWSIRIVAEYGRQGIFFGPERVLGTLLRKTLPCGGQTAEIQIRIAVMNRFSALGTAEFEAAP